MISRLATEDEKRNEILKYSNQSCMVEAGAGAGKTTIIKKRVASQLKSGALKPSELVVITFTKAAAGELRERISKVLEEEYENAKDEIEKKNLKNAIENQSMIQISTIHSFCFRLLEERALDISLPLDIAMLEEADNKKRIDDFFKKWYKAQDKDEIVSLNKEFYLKDYSKYVYECFKEICDLPDDMNFRYYDDLLNSWKLKDYINHIKEQGKRIEEEILKVVKSIDFNVSTIEEACSNGLLYASVRDFYKGLNSKNLYVLLEAYKKASKKDTYVLSSLEKNGDLQIFKNKNLKAYNASFLEKLQGEENYSIKISLYQNALVLYLALRARKDYNDALKLGENRHFVSNDQLLKMSLELVKNENALKHFQDEFKYIYVDEFQDTDTVQRDLVFKLVSDINTNKLRDSSFFLVGDPKQSIYAFRGADLEVYKNTKDYLKREDQNNVYVYELSRNHRSDPKIIDWVNREFKSKEYGLGDLYLEMTCKHKGNSCGHILSGVYTLARPKDAPSKDAKLVKKDMLEREVYFLPKFINSLIKNYQINEYNKEGDVVGSRAINYSDFLVLARAKDVLEYYADSLKENEIPVNLNGALDLENDAIVLRYKALIHYLANPLSDKARYGAMEVLLRSLITKDNNKEATKALDEFFEMFHNMSAYATVEYLAHHIKYFLDEENNKAQIDYIQSSLQQLLEYLQGQGIHTLNEYDDLIDTYISSGLDKSLSLTRDLNAVRLMNLHKSKGLEGKIVIVLARFKVANDINDSYRNMYDYYPTIKPSKKGTHIASYSKGNDAILDEDIPKMARADEYKRLEYVEATRAEEALIFFDKNCSAQTMFDKFNFEGCPDLTKENKDINEIYKDIIINGKMGHIESKYSYINPSLDNFDISLSDNQSLSSYTISSPSDYEKYDDSWVLEKENRPSGQTFGTILHRVFELSILCIRDVKTLDKDEIINTAILESYHILKENHKERLDGYIKYMKEYLNVSLDDFLNSDLIDKIKSAKGVYPEYQFNLFISDDMKKDLYEYIEKGTVYLNGKVDLVLVYEDHLDIYDYKTDYKGEKSISELEKHLEDTYSLQQKLYSLAMSFCFKMDYSKIQYHFYHLYKNNS